MAGPSPKAARAGSGRFPIEMELLLAFARRDLRPQDTATAKRAIEAGVDWNLVVTHARAHRLVPLLRRHINDQTLEPGLAVRLRARADGIAQGSLALASELIRVLRLCAEHGIVAVPLKGPVLAEQVYGTVALRQMDDLDVLVSGDDLERTTVLLEDAGYRRESDLPVRLRSFERECLHHLTFVVPSGLCRLELHHSLLPLSGGRRVGLERIAHRLTERRFMGTPVHVLDSEAVFAYLCEHGGLHAWGRLEWLATAAELLGSGSVRDWDRVESAARIFGSSRRIASATALMHELLGAEVGELTRDRLALAANRAVLHRLAVSPDRAKARRPESFAFQIATDAGWSARMRRAYTVAAIPHAADLQFLPLPRAAWACYLALRPIRLGVRALLPKRERLTDPPSAPSVR